MAQPAPPTGAYDDVQQTRHEGAAEQRADFMAQQCPVTAGAWGCWSGFVDKDVAVSFAYWVALEAGKGVGEQANCLPDRPECGALRSADHGAAGDVVAGPMPGALQAPFLGHVTVAERGARWRHHSETANGQSPDIPTARRPWRVSTVVIPVSPSSATVASLVGSLMPCTDRLKPGRPIARHSLRLTRDAVAHRILGVEAAAGPAVGTVPR